MKTGSLRLSGLALVAVVLATGCTPEPAAESAGSSEAEQGLADLLPYGREPWPGILTAGQPTKQDFEMLRDRGVRTVINLRVPSESGTRDEPEWIKELGMAYISIPVAGAAGVNEETARALDRALETAERPVLVHCGSSNRVGAVFALRAFHLEGKSAEDALEIGRSSGVTRLEDHVRGLLE